MKPSSGSSPSVTVPSRISKTKCLRTMSWARFSRGSPLGGFRGFLHRRINNSGLTCSFSHEKIMEAQCELLISNFNDSKMIAIVKENIRRISDGSSSHCAGALNLGLKKAFELKKQKRQPPGVWLRCSRSGCGWHSCEVPYSMVGQHTYCQVCRHSHGKRYLQCIGCSFNRTGAYASCQSCGMRFL